VARQSTINLPLWQRALTTIQSKPVSVVFVGSSTTQGTAATTASRRYIEVLGGMVRRRIGTTNDDHIHFSTSADDDIITKNGTIARSYSGLSHQNYVMSPGATLTFAFSGRAITILYTQGAGTGTFTVTIDGGAPTLVTPATSGVATSHTGSTTITGLSAGPHTAVITATATTRFCGAVAHTNNTDRGLYLYNSGIGGATTQMFADDTSHTQRLQALSPHLIMIMLGSNDYANNTSLATYMTKMTKLVTDIRRDVASQPDILLVHSYQRFDVTAPTHSWSAYGAALSSVARATNCAFLDISGFYPTSQAADIIRSGGGHASEGLIGSDGIHQTDYGYSYMARLLLDSVL
jgi:lysophospholipase L1-like esterase